MLLFDVFINYKNSPFVARSIGKTAQRVSNEKHAHDGVMKTIESRSIENGP